MKVLQEITWHIFNSVLRCFFGQETSLPITVDLARLGLDKAGFVRVQAPSTFSTEGLYVFFLPSSRIFEPP